MSACYELGKVMHDIGDPRRDTFHPVASTLLKCRTLKLLWWIQKFDQSVYNPVLLYADMFSNDKQLFNEITFVKCQKYEHGGRMKNSYFVLRIQIMNRLHLDR